MLAEEEAPLVSILVPIYNHEEYIVECLDAIASQDYQNIELLIIDDGSTDGSYDVVIEWLACHMEINSKFVRQENQGVCHTLNSLIKMSEGEFITLCASDDIIAKDGISSRMATLESFPSKMAVIGDARLIDQNSREVAPSAMKHLYNANFDRLKDDICSELIFRWSVVGPTLLIRRSAYDYLGFYDETLAVEDREFYLRLLAKDALVFISNKVASYRIHTGNTSRKNYKAKMKIYEQVALSNLKHANNFSGIKSLFLKSYKYDLVLLHLGVNRIAYSIVFSYRVFRYLFFKVFLLI